MSFTFHGGDPSDWDAEVFHYELRFVEPPSDRQLARLGALYGKWFARGASEPGGWVFADRFAYFSVAMRHDARASFSQVEAFLQVVHSIAPIDEAIHTTAADEFPELDPGPRFQPSARPIDPSLPEPAPAESFQAALARTQDAARLAKLEKLIDGVKPKEPKLRLTPPVPPTPQSAHSAELHARFAGTEGYFIGPVGRPARQVIEVRSRDGMQSAGWVSTAEGRIELPAGLLVWPSRVYLRPEATHALLPAAPQIGKGPYGPIPGKHELRVFEADLGERTVRLVWECAPEAGELQGCAYLGDGQIAVLQESRLTIVELDAEGLGRELGRTRVSEGSRVFSLHDGQLVFVDTFKGIRLFAWLGGKLRALANYKHGMLFFHTEADGEIILRQGGAPPFLQPETELDPNDQFLAIVGVEASLEALRPKPKKPRTR